MLIRYNFNYFESFNLSDFASDILSYFIVSHYGHFEDFKAILYTHQDRFGLPTYFCNIIGDQMNNWRVEINKNPMNTTNHFEYSVIKTVVKAIDALTLLDNTNPSNRVNDGCINNVIQR